MGKVVVDNVEVGGLHLKNARIGVVTAEKGSAFEHAAFSGLVGMAYPSLARAGMHPVFDQMMHSKLMKNNRFTFFMSDTEGSKAKSGIWFDDVPKSLFKGELKKHPVIAKGYWSVKLLDIKVGGKPTGVCGNKGCKAAVDSGTSLLTAPSRIAKTVLGAIAANQEQLADVGASPDEWVDVMGCQSFKTSPKLTYVIEAEAADGSKHAVDYDLTPE